MPPLASPLVSRTGKPCYVISLYGGQAAIYVPGAVAGNFQHQVYNARYGVEVIAPAAVFIVTLVNSISLSRFRRLGHIVVVGIIIVQTVLTALGGVIFLQDGQYGLDCAHAHSVVVFLAQHYGGGKILEDLYTIYAAPSISHGQVFVGSLDSHLYASSRTHGTSEPLPGIAPLCGLSLAHH